MSIERTIQPGEEIVYRAQASRIVLVPLALVTAAVALVAVVLSMLTANPFVLAGGGLAVALGLGGLAVELIILRSREYVLTNRRVVSQTGIFSKRSIDAYLDKINNVEHRQSFWGRLLNYGHLEIDTASETGTTVFAMISDPLAFKQQIQMAAQQARTGFSAAPQKSGADRLRELKALLDDGLITPEEYETKRKELLVKL
ncbi:MAG: SHOCT domain-containing protein [Thermoanaerobaculia bacterium]